MKKTKIAVLGAGRMGSVIAKTLADSNLVTLYDYSQQALDAVTNAAITKKRCDLTDSDLVTKELGSFEFAINATPGTFGYSVLEAAIKASCNVVDLAFFEEDPFTLTKLAKKHNVTAFVDCGVAPGLANIFAANGASIFSKVDEATIYVGGLPQDPNSLYHYKTVYSPVDAISFYVRPARVIENGTLTVKQPLSEPEDINFDGIGSPLEAFVTDGARTLFSAIQADIVQEKTIRYKGHREKIELLRDTGYLSTTPIDINGTKISPLSLTEQLLIPLWQREEGEQDLTLLRVLVKGVLKEKHSTKTYELIDRYDTKTDTTSMARTTGYTACAIMNLMLNDNFKEKGVFGPEVVGQSDKLFNNLKSYLMNLGVVWKEK